MAFAILTCLLNTIEFHFLQPIPCFNFDDREIINSLCKKLRFLQSYLEESENNNDARRVLETKIKGVADDAETKIESELHQLYTSCNKVDRPVKPPQSLYKILQQVTREIKSIERRIIHIESNNNQHSVDPQRRNTTTVENIKVSGSFSKRSTEPKNDVMVGCDDVFDSIMHNLLSHSQNLEVISIVGMGGIGKTTLVKRVYEDATVVSHFDILAWATVSQQHNLGEILLGLLGSIDNNGRDISDLANQLRQELIGRRYLVVIDDIWGTNAWDDLHRCFPEKSNGSRVLLTTRLKQVADYASSGNHLLHYMRFLNPTESWNLFYKKVFEENKVPLEFETIGRGIVEKCQGLPLAIIVVAGLLTTFNSPSLKHWRNIGENLNSLLSTDPEEKCSKILSLSYNHLPPQLKVCFLYFGVFPEDSEIRVKNLIRLWVSEGFLKVELNKSMEEVGEACLEELVDRGLVQIDKRSFGGKMKCCRLHDVLHSFCLREAQRENLLDVINKNNVHQMATVQKQPRMSLNCFLMRTMSTGSNLKACRWISSQLKDLDLPITEARYKNHTSLVFSPILYFSYDDVYVVLNYHPKSFPFFKLLRVLDISSRLIPEDHMPSNIENLVNLRYLALRIRGFFPHNYKWFNLRSLQTIIIYTTGRLPNDWESELDIFDMPRLRHVYVNGCFFNLPKLVQGNLQTLSWLNLPHQGWQTKLDFKMIPNLKELGIHIKCNLVSDLPPGLLDGLADLHKLENLKVAASYETISRDHFRLLTAALPLNLKKLSLYHTYLSREDMAIIGTLPNIEVLKLIGYAFTGQEWKTVENEFCRLKYLQIEDSGLKHWSIVHFPILECLILSKCWHLEELPDSFVDITSLQLIELISCQPSLVTSAKRIQEERLDYGDDKLVIRDTFCTLVPREELEEDEEMMRPHAWSRDYSLRTDLV